jgi:1-acyl-sn-glycerol-3-phosphate acyltransferase
MEQPDQISRKLKLTQALMGASAFAGFAATYLRRTHGTEKLDARQRYLFVCNHVSLLDTILIGGLCWRAGCYPILVLGDKNVWSTSWLKRALSRPIGFLLERGRLNPGRIRELQNYARQINKFHLVVFPEGTRGNGVDVAECQPGIFYVAQESRAPIVPVFIENMQLVSTKEGRFHPFGGLQKIEVHFGEPVAPENYLPLSRDEFTEFVRRKISEAGAKQVAAQLNPVAQRG